MRILRATANDPNGTFTKSSADVLTPSTEESQWDYGWLGGVQVMARPTGGYMMVFNAGDTRPATAGSEPNTSRAGYAYAHSLEGPWTKDPANPYFSPAQSPSDGHVEKTNVWRTFLAYDESAGRWFAYYNTQSIADGGERITYGVAGPR